MLAFIVSSVYIDQHLTGLYSLFSPAQPSARISTTSKVVDPQDSALCKLVDQVDQNSISRIPSNRRRKETTVLAPQRTPSFPKHPINLLDKDWSSHRAGQDNALATRPNPGIVPESSGHAKRAFVHAANASQHFEHPVVDRL